LIITEDGRSIFFHKEDVVDTASIADGCVVEFDEHPANRWCTNAFATRIVLVATEKKGTDDGRPNPVRRCLTSDDVKQTEEHGTVETDNATDSPVTTLLHFDHCNFVLTEVGKITLQQPSSKGGVAPTVGFPGRLVIHTDHIKTLTSCFTELRRLPRWDLTYPQVVADGDAPDAPDAPDVRKVIADGCLRDHRGVAVMCPAQSEKVISWFEDGKPASRRRRRQTVGVFYLTVDRLYYSADPELHKHWSNMSNSTRVASSSPTKMILASREAPGAKAAAEPAVEPSMEPAAKLAGKAEQPVALPVDTVQPEQPTRSEVHREFVGRYVRKRFAGSGWFTGKVIGVDSEAPGVEELLIVYTDEDEEVLDEKARGSLFSPT
jgi:hypothetical protein